MRWGFLLVFYLSLEINTAISQFSRQLAKMYIESIRIKGFRNFVDSSISFNEGINAIIGHNNAGKSNLLKALGLVLNSNVSRRLDVEDFNKNVDVDALNHQPPQIRIELRIIQSHGEDLNSDDL